MLTGTSTSVCSRSVAVTIDFFEHVVGFEDLAAADAAEAQRLRATNDNGKYACQILLGRIRATSEMKAA